VLGLMLISEGRRRQTMKRRFFIPKNSINPEKQNLP